MPNRTNLDALDVNLIPSGDRPADRSQTPRLAAWLTAAVEHQANDLLLVAGAPPSLRINGRIVTSGSNTLNGEEILSARRTPRGFNRVCPTPQPDVWRAIWFRQR